MYIVECRVSILGITIMIWGICPITVPRTLWVGDQMNLISRGSVAVYYDSL